MPKVTRSNFKRGDVLSLGCVLANGTLVHGNNALVVSTIAGIYDISFIEYTPGNTCYVVQLTIKQNPGEDDYIINYKNKLDSGFRVEIREQDNGGSNGILVSEDFDFLSININ